MWVGLPRLSLSPPTPREQEETSPWRTNPFPSPARRVDPLPAPAQLIIDDDDGDEEEEEAALAGLEEFGIVLPTPLPIRIPTKREYAALKRLRA